MCVEPFSDDVDLKAGISGNIQPKLWAQHLFERFEASSCIVRVLLRAHAVGNKFGLEFAEVVGPSALGLSAYCLKP